MTVFQAVLLGALQGLSEFLPISSSGHLVVFRNILGIGNIPLLFDVLLHVSTLIVICIVFRKRIVGIIASLVRIIGHRKREGDDGNLRLFYAILVATVVTAVLGLGVSSLDMASSPRIVSAFFLVTAGILILSRFAKGDREIGSIGVREGFITGIAQGIGVFPGISRSGITISAALGAGIRRERAGEFAFLISIPAVLGALILELKDLDAMASEIPAFTVVVGMITAFIVGYLSLLLVLNLLQKAKIHLFAFYLIPLGIAGLIFL